MSHATLEQTSPTATQAVAQKTSGKPPKTPLLARIGTILVWQIIAILFVEFTLFCAGLGEEEIFKLDPELGSVHLPNKRVTWRSEGYSVSWFNDVGMRESNISVEKPAGTLRVALLGDSLTEALQVPLETSFGRVMERKLSTELKRPVQVLNFGVSGYSTAQEYILLKRRVLAYKPDVVLACYNSRDSFENWSAPDQVITNVRPYALHLPGGKLTIDTSPVTNWMKTPRAKFLQQSEWLRQNSRLWGLFAALELDWSLHNDSYRYLLLFVTRPGKAIRELTGKVKAEFNKLTSSAQSTAGSAEKGQPTAATGTTDSRSAPVAAEAPVKKAPAVTAPANSKTSASDTASTGSKPATKLGASASEKVTTAQSAASSGTSKIARRVKLEDRPTYQQFIMRSLGSLLIEMQKETQAATGGRFAVVAMPVRSALCPAEGIDTAFNEFTYKDEIVMLEEICTDKKINLIDLQKPAESFEAPYRKDMFYSVHLTKLGHDYVGDQLANFVKPLLLEGSRDPR